MIIVYTHCRWAMKFQNLEPNDVLLSSKDRPKLPLIFYVKECLSPALSAAKPIAFERVFLSLTSVPVSNCKTHNLFYNIQKMNCLLPSIWSFTQAFFLFLWQLNLLQSEELAQLRQGLRLSSYLLTLIQRKIEQILCQEREI